MARKSRKHLQQGSEPVPEKKTYTTAGYVRLSSDDRRKRGDSIATQKQIIHHYIDQYPDMCLRDYYIDNSVTGRSFERPAFQKMIADAQNGVIDCIIVKDLSRFGRNAIDAGFYIENHLPALGVRFIAIGDGFDTNNGDGGILLPLKNVVNEAYALDISRKCKAVQRRNIADGKFIGGRAPYGYVKAPEDCRRLVVDEETAPVVRRIFGMAKEGISHNEIARTLNDEGIPSPSRDKRQKGLITSEKLVAQYWSRGVISWMLSDRVYVGDMVQGKTRIVGFTEVNVPREEWVTVENTHEPIVCHTLFDEVQDRIGRVSREAAKKRNPTVSYTPSLFKGKIFCGHCGYTMHRHRTKDVYWFNCQSQTKYSKSACVQVSVKEEDLKFGAAVMLRKYAETLLGKTIKLCKKALNGRESIQDMQSELTRVRQDMHKNRSALKYLFEQMMEGKITSAVFAERKAENAAKLAALIERAMELETSPKRIQTRIKECWELADCVTAVKCKYDLTTDILDSLVEKILVYHDKSFEVVWRFSDEIEERGAMAV